MASQLFHMVTTLLVMAMTTAIISASAGRYEFSINPKAEIHMRLKQLNKPAVKSIESLDGDIIDCVPIANQPAFDHPLLQNHTIQMSPSFEPRDGHIGNAEASPKTILQLWRMNGECPENTVPIRRTKEQDLLRSTSLESFGKKTYNSIRKVGSSGLYAARHEYAIMRLSNGNYYGSKSVINLWKPFVQQNDEFSLAQIGLSADNSSGVNTIEAGLQVFPGLYGDNNTKLFIYWTRDGYQNTGCYNLLCSGFVQTDRTWVLGGTISPTSVYGGDQYEISLLIWKDTTTGNWWLQIQGTNVGYWPWTLFTTLAIRATRVDWGGEIMNQGTNGQHTTTNMGSGHFPSEGYEKTAYFRNLEIVDGSSTLRPATGLSSMATHPTCYNVMLGGAGSAWGSYFNYGGPGRNPNCHENI